MSDTHFFLDLTQRPPRSPRVRLGGYVLLPRILDKGRAVLAGKLGEYHFSGIGMDRHFFNFTGLDHETFKAQLDKGGSDEQMLAWVAANAKHPRQPWEISAWSNYYEHRVADSDAETITYFAEAVGKHSKTREDIRTWFELMDVDDYCSFGGKA